MKKKMFISKEAYLRKIMRNYWYDECRKKKTRQLYAQSQANSFIIDQDDNLVHISQNSDELIDLIITQNEVEKLWGVLDDHQRELLYLYSVLEYTTQEIVDELDLPRGTVLGRIHRLKKYLKAQALNTSRQEDVS